MDGVHRVQVKVLHIDDLAHLALFQQFHHGAADAADGPAHFDVPLIHILLQEQVGGQGGASHAGLEGEAVLEIGGGGDDLGHVLRHHQIPGILGDAGGGGCDLLGIADGVHHHHGVHVDGLYAGREVGKVHQAVGDHHHMVGVLGVGHGVAQGAAVALAAHAPAVAYAVAGGGGHESDVDVDLSGLNGPGASAVAADDGGGLELARGHHLAHSAPDARGLDADHLALLDVVGDGVVGGAQAGGRDGQIFQAQLLDGGGHHQVDHIVPVAQVVVEGEGHAAPGAALAQGLRQTVHQLALLGLFIPPGAGRGLLNIFAVHIVFALIDLPAFGQEVIRDLTSYCVFHTKSPSYIPQARASFRVRSAPGMNAMSIILPSTVNTPTPAADCSR